MKFAFKYVKKNNKSPAINSIIEIMQNEASIHMSLDHPNIAKAYEVNLEGMLIKTNGIQIPVAYIVLEYLLGDIFEYLSLTGKFTERTTRFFFKQLISAITYLHGRGYVHTDIKPEHLLLDEKFNLKLTSFGYGAPIQGKDGSGFLNTRLGTIHYMPPEIVASQPYKGSNADIFSLGVTLFVMVTSILPFKAAAITDQFYSNFIQNNCHIFWATHNQRHHIEISTELKDLVQKMLGYDPNQRPSLKEILAHPWMSGDVPITEERLDEFNHRSAIISEHSFKNQLETTVEKKIFL